MKFVIHAHVRLSNFPEHIRRLGISAAAFTVDVPVELFEGVNEDGSMTQYAGVPPEDPASLPDPAAAAPAKRGRRKKGEGEAAPAAPAVPAAQVAPTAASPSFPMPLPTINAPSTMIEGVRTFPPSVRPNELTHINAAVELNGGAGTPAGTPIPIAGQAPMAAAPWQGAQAPWAAPPQAPPQMTLQELQSKMMQAYHINGPGFLAAMNAAGINAAAATVADAPRVLAALAPIIGQGS